jgi:hypothetical protein
MRVTPNWGRVPQGAAPIVLISLLTSLRGAVPVHAAPAPLFEGVAVPHVPGAGCPQIVPPSLNDPFSELSNRVPPVKRPHVTVQNYRLVACWLGTLNKVPFVYDEFASTDHGGGLAVLYNGMLVTHVTSGGAPPFVERFTGISACWVEQAGAYYFEVNLRTGYVYSNAQEQRLCAPARYPPRYVLGLAGHHHPFLVEDQR